MECDNLQGGSIAAKHLNEKGCKNLIHLSGVYETAMPADLRAQGFRETCNVHNISCKIIETSLGQYNALEYHDFLERILLEYPETDGIFASSDLIAAQSLQVCSKLNRRVPEDIKVVGFDDVNIASLTTPRITTIHQPIKEMAELAIQILRNAIDGKIVPNKTALPVHLVEREST